MKENRLTPAVKLGYGVADFGAGMMIMAVGLYLLIYMTDVVGLKPELAGLALLIGKIYDAVTDPLAGYLSDHTRTALGRRRPYLLAAAVPFGLGFALLFYRPDLLMSDAGMFWYMLGIFLFLNTAFTFYNVPYSSLAADMTEEYDQRTSLTSYRMLFSMLGTLVAAGGAMLIVELGRTTQSGYSLMGTLFGGTIILVSLITFFSTRETLLFRREENPLPFMAGTKAALQCRPFLLAVIIFFLVQVALSLLLAVLMYYLSYVVDMEAQSNFVTLAFMLTAICSLPLWVKVSKSIGKARTWAVGILIQVPALLILAFLPSGRPLLVYGLAVLAGLGTAPHYLCPWAMVPDVVEYDQLVTGEKRAGVFSGLWLLTQKAAMAVGMALTGGLLALFGYQAGAAQSALAMAGIRSGIGPVPGILLIAGALLLWRYPINRASHEQVKLKLAGKA